MPVRVVVHNNTGRPIRVAGCGTLFQVALASMTYTPAVGWLQCLQFFTIAAGQSSYRTTVDASYLQCHNGRPGGGIRSCLPGGRMPPLPPGIYHAVLFSAVRHLANPPSVTVQVTSP